MLLFFNHLGYSLEQVLNVLMALRAIGLYLTLDQQVVFSGARITGVANLPPGMWSRSKSNSCYLSELLDQELNPGPRLTKLMIYH